MEYSAQYVGELVRTEKHVLGLAVDVEGKHRAVRLRSQSMFLILSTGENDKNTPAAWRDIPLYKILPVGSRAYDDFSLNVKFCAVSIYVEPVNIELVTDKEKENSP